MVNTSQAFQRFFVEPDDTTTLDDPEDRMIFKNQYALKYLNDRDCNTNGIFTYRMQVTASSYQCCVYEGKRGLQTLKALLVWEGYEIV